MTTGSSEHADALLLRDAASAASAAGEPWQRPEPPPSARYTIVGDSLRVETGEGVTEVVHYDIPTLLGQAGRYASDGAWAEADGLVAERDALKAWILTVLDRVPEAYGHEGPPEQIIDRWLDDLVNVYDAGRALGAAWGAATARDPVDLAAVQHAEEALAAALDRVRTDEEGDTDARG